MPFAQEQGPEALDFKPGGPMTRKREALGVEPAGGPVTRKKPSGWRWGCAPAPGKWETLTFFGAMNTNLNHIRLQSLV